MFYPLPKKIQLSPSLAKWSVSSNDSILLISGLDHLRTQHGFEQSELNTHLNILVKKAKALEIPIINLSDENLPNSMMLLGEQMSVRKQIFITGIITAQLKQFIEYFRSVTSTIAVVNDAIVLANIEQHIQWIESMSQNEIHHLNTYSVSRLWSLSAPKEMVLSPKGILLAVAEHLDMEALEIDPTVKLIQYGLDSVSIVSLVGLWRANGANIQYEDLKDCSLQQLMPLLVS